MLCPICEQERDDKDFYNNQMGCYKCIYKQKVKLSGKSTKKRCATCGEGIYDKFRLTYCSNVCAEKGRNKIRHDRWACHYQGAPITYF